jgi:beta-glucoside operon transcriptional antiterminator
MKIVRNINNNVSLCKDSKGREVVIFGKGVGFLKVNEEVPLSKIERTFYNVNKNYLDVIASLPENVIEVSSKIIDIANIKLNMFFAIANSSLLQRFFPRHWWGILMST